MWLTKQEGLGCRALSLHGLRDYMFRGSLIWDVEKFRLRRVGARFLIESGSHSKV